MWLSMELKFISLFAGCGGSSLGYKMAGYIELLAIEWESNAVETFKLNFPEVPIWQKDIKEITGKEILNFCNLREGELDLLDGSPPCQGFSSTGKRKVNDTRNDLFIEYARLVIELNPKVFVMENVSGMVKGKMKGKFIEIINMLKSLNYNVKCKLMNAMYYNVPQSRQRLIFIGIRKDLNIEPSFPNPSNYIIKVKQALKDCPLSEIEYPKGEVCKYYENIKIGSDLASYFESQGLKRKYFSVKKIDLNRPLNTITKIFANGMAGLLYPNEKRFLTIAELKRCQTFPDDFKMLGSFKDQWARIGNSVPPKFMEAIANHLKDKLFRIKKSSLNTIKNLVETCGEEEEKYNI